MLKESLHLRPKSEIPPYPNYHIGDYFEEYFFNRFLIEYEDLNVNEYEYIPIFWTNCYTNKVFGNSNYNIQEFLDGLDENRKYFMISQHDDCVYEQLPKNTLIFSMGGNKRGKNIIPIPLICSPIPTVKKNKQNKISFVGSITHPIRQKLYQKYKDNDNFIFFVKNWELNSSVKDINNFIQSTSECKFTLSPRGYGATSFRLYESMQLNSVPIYVSDNFWLPWENEIEWSKLSILIKEDNIQELEEIVKNHDYDMMIKYKNKVFDTYFTYDGVYNNIIKTIKNGNFEF